MTFLKKQKNKNSCSYCNESGHNKSTCLEKKDALQKIEIINAQTRKSFVENLNSLGFYINSFVEMINVDWFADSQQTIELFYVKQIKWNFINTSSVLLNDKKIKFYLDCRGAVTTNFGNIVLISPSYPLGLKMTLTEQRLRQIKNDKSPLDTEKNVYGDFRVVDVGDKQKTLDSIPKYFFEGKFYDMKANIIK